MIIYLIWRTETCTWCGKEAMLGVFSSREKAETWLDEHTKTYPRNWAIIEETLLDA